MTTTLKTLADELERLFVKGDWTGNVEGADPLWLIGQTPLCVAALRACETVREALDRLARLGNGEHYGNSDGNMIARIALAELEKVGKL